MNTLTLVNKPDAINYKCKGVAIYKCILLNLPMAKLAWKYLNPTKDVKTSNPQRGFTGVAARPPLSVVLVIALCHCNGQLIRERVLQTS